MNELSEFMHMYYVLYGFVNDNENDRKKTQFALNHFGRQEERSSVIHLPRSDNIYINVYVYSKGSKAKRMSGHNYE